MKRRLCTGIVILLLSFTSVRSEAQIPIYDIIKQGITKVIVAVDLKIQRLQNKTIWLQNVQKTLENEMSRLKLNEISNWAEKQRKLYEDYFQELWQVKSALSYYNRVKDIFQRQIQMVVEYKKAWSVLKQDKNFTPQELDAMFTIYTGILDESAKNLDQLFLVVGAFTTQMSDGKRLEIINSVADKIEENFTDLKEFNHQNKLIAIQRASEKGEIDYLRKLYGL